MPPHRLPTAPSLALLFTAFSTALVPSSARDDDAERQAVQRAVEAGEILPLAEILEKVRVRVPGDITGVEVDREGGRWHYEIRVIDRGGRVLEVHVDAQTGRVEDIEEK